MPSSTEDIRIENNTICFYTASIVGWKRLLTPDKYKQIILDSLSYLTEKQRVKIYGFVIMPNHLHMLWRVLPPSMLADVQRDFMKFTSQTIKFDLVQNHPDVLSHFRVDSSDRAYQFWQRNSLNKSLPSRKIVEEKLDYIHNNPCQGRWMLVKDPLEYSYSSIRFYERDENEFAFLSHYMEFFE